MTGSVENSLPKCLALMVFQFSEAVAVNGLKLFVRTTELDVDEVHNAGPLRAGVVIGRDDLIADSGKGAGFLEGEETPGEFGIRTGDGTAGRGGNGS